MRDLFGLDVRYAFRSLRRTPAFTATVVLTLALGIGANAAIFSVLNGVLLRPLPFSTASQLVAVSSRYPQFPDLAASLSVPEYREFGRMTPAVADVGAFRMGEVNITAGDHPLRVKATRVDQRLLAVLGVHPAYGRFFTPEEIAVANGVGGAPVVVLSYEPWQAAFGGERVVGRKWSSKDGPMRSLASCPPVSI